MKKHVVAAMAVLLSLLTPAFALAQFDTDADCGAAGYACLNGRSCSSGRCVPAWQDVSLSGAPSGVVGGASERIGGGVAVFGGCTSSYSIDAGAFYDLSTDSWSSFSPAVAQRQYAYTAPGDGGIYQFGGLTGCYDPWSVDGTLEFIGSPSDPWSPVDSQDAPSARYNGSMIWTGSGLFLYGGSDTNIPALEDGGSVVPGFPWSVTTCPGCAKAGPFDMWTEDLGGLLGLGVRVWGGSLTYSLSSDTWSDAWVSPSGGPDFGSDLCATGAAATGDDDGSGRMYYLGSGGVWTFDKAGASWSFDTAGWPSGLSNCAAAAWSGGELVAWSGDGGQYGARYQPPAP